MAKTFNDEWDYFRALGSLKSTEYPSNNYVRLTRHHLEVIEFQQELLERLYRSLQWQEDLLDQAVGAASADKLGECLSTLFRVKELRKESQDEHREWHDRRLKELAGRESKE